MPNVVKQMVLRELQEELEGIEGVLLFSMNGLTVAENESFRGSMADGGVRVRVVSNALTKRALAEYGHEFPEDVFVGPTAMACGSPEHTIHAAKCVQDSPMRKEGKLAFKAGMLEGNVLGKEDAAALAALPDKDTVRAMLLGVLSGPARGLATIISAVPSSVARVVQARIDEGGGAEEPAAAETPAAEESPSAEAQEGGEE